MLASWLQRVWYQRRPPPWLLRPWAWLFGRVVALRRQCYQRGWLASVALPVPVIVVGNLTVGGSGKTPLVLWLVEQLRQAGWTPGVVLRGYGGRISRTGSCALVSAASQAVDVGDEALLLFRRGAAPVAIGRDRAAAAKLLLDAGTNIIVADDGLQHLRLRRTLEWVVLERSRGVGNGWMLPAGPLREGRERLRQVDALILNGAGPAALGGLPAHVMTLAGDTLHPVASGDGGAPRTQPLAALSGRWVHAVAGIGNPERFFQQLAAAGLKVKAHPFPDHHPFVASDLVFEDDLPVLMTEKDAVKCARISGANCWYLPVTAQLSPESTQQLLAGVHSRTGLPPHRMEKI